MHTTCLARRPACHPAHCAKLIGSSQALKRVTADFSPKTHQQIDISFVLYMYLSYLAHGPDRCSALHPDH